MTIKAFLFYSILFYTLTNHSIHGKQMSNIISVDGTQMRNTISIDETQVSNTMTLV